MDNFRVILAIVLSVVIIIGYQYFFVGFNPAPPPAPKTVENAPVAAQPAAPPAVIAQEAPTPQPPVKPGRDITVRSDLFTAVVSENGAALKSLVLNRYKENNKKTSPGKELVTNEAKEGYPLKFSWGDLVGDSLFYQTDSAEIDLRDAAKSAGQTATLVMRADAGNGIQVERRYGFQKGNYLFSLDITVKNTGDHPVQGIPALAQINPPFERAAHPADQFLFKGPIAFIGGKRIEVPAKDLADGPRTEQGDIEWAGYEGNYFLRAIVPMAGDASAFTMSGGEQLTMTQLAGKLETITPGAEKTYSYKVFYGPKNIRELRAIGYNLERSVDFGWFDIIARPTLWLLNFFYGIVKNYGVAIILVTVLFKAVFWPISQKGLKSMKNMQKLQPKMVKLKEKYKDDPSRLNQEVMNLYKTYKVNPMGGCLPIIVQIPVFFALYKVLLQSIELRHAPFMLWINDLSAPDRLPLGFDIPYLGGLPVLTLLMGASMWYQQKITPTSADPTQAKILMFMPVLFTFMFLNFPAGLVLYWLVNNLLSILQQKLILRETGKNIAAPSHGDA
ncbi:MAG: membrane protein insertase YidC [Desulfobulbaceae bacterium]|jgi:YidC/Oxa1 family membrane protein insertase|nr:membrane protein insertase YidC [Desulfobulbaceae bacterium]